MTSRSPTSWARALYSAVTWAAQPLLRRKLLRRAEAEPVYAEHIPERFGRYQPATLGQDGRGRWIWIHAVSLGETRAAAILLTALRERLPGMRLLLTHGTATGRTEGRRLLQSGDLQVWQPWDTPAVVRRFVQQFRPAVGVLMETEVWPNLVAICREEGVPLALANARLSDKSLGQALRVALQTSGLFYESHLTDMVFGRSNPAQLQQEPQAKLTRSGVPSEADLARPRADSAGTSASRSGGDAPTTSGGANTPAPGTPVSGIHQDLTVLVRQQLDVLANQALTWQGEAWPGTPMEWEVEREPYGGDPDSGVPTWATRLKLDLPRLGLVDARLNLAGDQIVLQLVAPHGAAELNESSDQLRSRLLAAGLTLSHLVVNVVDPRPVMPTDF